MEVKMARTTKMRLLELMVLKQDISSVIGYIGKKGSFQFQTKKTKSDKNASSQKDDILDIDSQIYKQLIDIAQYLGIHEFPEELSKFDIPTENSRKSANDFLIAFNELKTRIDNANNEAEKINNAYKEANAFSNLQVSYSELEHLSFLSLRIGKVVQNEYEKLKESLLDIAVVVPLGDDKTHILVASSKKGRFAVDTELKNHGFIEMEIPQDFKGVPENVLLGLKNQKIESDNKLKEIETEKSNFIETHKQKLIELLGTFAIGIQISDIQKNLESTELVYRITGWIPESETNSYMVELDQLTESRIAIRVYEPYEIPSVISGKEQVPVKLSHGKFVKSFERMIFSYGSPVYGTIDPTPFVAIFFTLLFGIMFGDLGQGLVLALVGILLGKNVIKVGGWNKFAPIFIAIGCTSSIMGLLTGEFFSNETLLEPFAKWITGLFGNPHSPILVLMPSSDPNSIKAMFGVFGVAVAIGFVINTCGLVINIINNFIKRNYAEAIFGKNGISGAIFFWYVIYLIVRIAFFHYHAAVYDFVIVGVSLFFASFAEPFENLVNKKRPLLENGIGTYLISSVVEVIEVLSGYLSNTVSFVRVGAFALSHAVLDYVIYILTNLVGGQTSVAGIAVMILGNAIIIVLEGMIVAIQVVRLQYYEFFSKFFHETGSEFKPFKFDVKGLSKE